MKVTPSSLHSLKDNHSTLSCLLDPETGGIIDDTVITRLGPDSFYFVTNAGRRAEDLDYLTNEVSAFKSLHGNSSLNWTILSSSRALIALQGPKAAQSLQPLITANDASVDSDLRTLYFGQCRSLNLTFPSTGETTPSRLLISRTGYTGEDGFEVSIPTDQDPTLPTRIVTQLLNISASSTSTSTSSSDKSSETTNLVKLAGLAARDSLRLEAGMCLYGNDISTAQTPPTASLSWLVGRDRRDPASPLSTFNGSHVILPQLASPSKYIKERRVQLFVDPGSAARAGTPIVSLDDPSVQVGVVTSGLPSPTLNGQNIAMGYVKQGMHKKGTELGVLLRKKVRRAVVNSPFVPTKYYRG
ncbi:Aminomethyltransferase, mitochondrial [Ascosphaera aggregata]|nr:Aminomethyltransferase, mitochondrial [Ascosphaera aggregata]